MKLSVHKGNLNGTVQAPPSKSHTHRAYMLSALSSGISHIKSPLFGEDTNATLDAVRMLGAEVTVEGDEVTISGGNLHAADNIIDCKNSGSSIRMLAGIAANLPGKTSFTGDASLCKRPMLPLLDALKDIGAKIESENGCAPFSVTGPANGNEVFIRGDISSQFISALLLGAPTSPSGVKIHLTTPLASRPYVNITISAMKAHGVLVEETEDGFFVPGKQQYKPTDGFVSGDYSSAAFILAAGALTGKVTVTGLDENDPQGDKAILDILSRFGAKVSRNGDAVTVECSTL
ncbi:MAG TPA: 3-phosphoshikimate 1-carboxyvinyltransferase, partial [Methanocorpusculum sp.]|nr:3-phosphoshikimate 1-carboxyvinyltransferase [Methanocorpusculum sp.]